MATPAHNPAGQGQSAFTLVELLVAIAIVGLLMAVTVPEPGAVKTTPGVFLSLKTTCPVFTLSPTATCIVGFMPTKSGPSRATERTGCASEIVCSGSPSMGRSNPFEMRRISSSAVRKVRQNTANRVPRSVIRRAREDSRDAADSRTSAQKWRWGCQSSVS